MAQTGFTPIQLYYSTTASTAPTAANISPGELAINITDGKLYYEDNLGAVQTIAYKNVPLNTVTGTLAIANGGTGLTAPGASGNLLTSDGTVWTSTAPSFVTLASTQTLTNKRITPRVNTQTTTVSPWAWNSDSYDMQEFTALANALTINADAGTPTDGQKNIFRFQDNGTARALTWTTGTAKSFRAIGVILPTTTVISKTLYVGCIYNSADTRWDVIAVAQEA